MAKQFIYFYIGSFSVRGKNYPETEKHNIYWQKSHTRYDPVLSIFSIFLFLQHLVIITHSNPEHFAA